VDIVSDLCKEAFLALDGNWNVKALKDGAGRYLGKLRD
jgi:hypothetical protein